MLKTVYNKGVIEAGCDEAGRGCLAGPVFAAAVILPAGFGNRELTDSKLLKHEKRIELRNIIEKRALAWAVAMMDVEKIDEINILQASILAMQTAVRQLKTKPEFLIIDGNYFLPCDNIPHQCIIGGDHKYQSIAAASILTKTYRDEYMLKLHDEFPHYNWRSNKGYATAEHRKAIMDHGVCLHHRKSFNLNFQMRIGFSDW